MCAREKDVHACKNILKKRLRGVGGGSLFATGRYLETRKILTEKIFNSGNTRSKK